MNIVLYVLAGTAFLLAALLIPGLAINLRAHHNPKEFWFVYLCYAVSIILTAIYNPWLSLAIVLFYTFEFLAGWFEKKSEPKG